MTNAEALLDVKRKAATYLDQMRVDLEFMRQHVDEAARMLRELTKAVDGLIVDGAKGASPPSFDDIDLGF